MCVSVFKGSKAAVTAAEVKVQQFVFECKCWAVTGRHADVIRSPETDFLLGQWTPRWR